MRIALTSAYLFFWHFRTKSSGCHSDVLLSHRDTKYSKTVKLFENFFWKAGNLLLVFFYKKCCQRHFVDCELFFLFIFFFARREPSETWIIMKVMGTVCNLLPACWFWIINTYKLPYNQCSDTPAWSPINICILLFLLLSIRVLILLLCHLA